MNGCPVLRRQEPSPRGTRAGCGPSISGARSQERALGPLRFSLTKDLHGCRTVARALFPGARGTVVCLTWAMFGSRKNEDLSPMPTVSFEASSFDCGRGEISHGRSRYLNVNSGCIQRARFGCRLFTTWPEGHWYTRGTALNGTPGDCSVRLRKSLDSLSLCLGFMLHNILRNNYA